MKPDEKMFQKILDDVNKDIPEQSDKYTMDDLLMV
jgi:hypothetical protein